MPSDLQGLAIIKRYPEFMKLTACLMIAAFIKNGMSEVDNQYLISVLNFKPLDFSNVYIIFGVGSLTVQACLPSLHPCSEPEISWRFYLPQMLGPQ